MTQIKHIQSEVYATVKQENINLETGFITLTLEYFDMFPNNSRLGKFQYDAGSGYKDCTVPLGRDVGFIAPSEQPKSLALTWDAATDLGCYQSYSDVNVKITFYDRETGGTESDEIIYTISSIDFRAGSDDTASGATNKIVSSSNITNPEAYDPYLDALFSNDQAIRDTKFHFAYEIATDSDFSNIIFQKITSNDVTDWTADSLTFPTDGINGKNQFEIEYDGDAPDDADISTVNDYYFRIRIIPENVNFTSFTISSGTISESKVHGLDTYPFVWFKDASNSLLTPLNYSVDYLSNNKFSINFGEELSNSIDVFYSNIEPSSQSVSSSSTATVTHNNGDYPFVWFKDEDGIIQTPAQFEVKYNSSNEFEVDFGESWTGTIYYISGSEVPSETITAVDAGTLEIEHNKGTYPYLWFKNTDNILQTASNYEVIYNNFNKITVNFYESFLGTMYYFEEPIAT